MSLLATMHMSHKNCMMMEQKEIFMKQNQLLFNLNLYKKIFMTKDYLLLYKMSCMKMHQLLLCHLYLHLELHVLRRHPFLMRIPTNPDHFRQLGSQLICPKIFPYPHHQLRLRNQSLTEMRMTLKICILENGIARGIMIKSCPLKRVILFTL